MRLTLGDTGKPISAPSPERLSRRYGDWELKILFLFLMKLIKLPATSVETRHRLCLKFLTRSRITHFRIIMLEHRLTFQMYYSYAPPTLNHPYSRRYETG